MALASPLGAPVKRTEDPRLITGAGNYLDDIKLPGMTHAAILRSPYAHAKIVSIDTARAAAMPGVVAVFTGKDLESELNPLPCAWAAGGASGGEVGGVTNNLNTPRVLAVDDALAALAEHGDEAKLLAGGHSLLPLMKLRLATPAVLVDVNDVGELAGIDLDGDHVVIGALTRHCDLVDSPVLREHLPLLSAAAAEVGDPQVRHRGTLGGSIAHGDPASDLPAAVLALGGTITVQGPGGVRTLAADDFFLGFLETALSPDEMITELRFPRRTGAGWAFEKFTKRAQDWAIVGVAAVGGEHPGVGLVNMAATPVRASSVEAALREGASAADAAALADAESDPSADLNASAEFRRHLARVLVGRALTTIERGDARSNGSASTP